MNSYVRDDFIQMYLNISGCKTNFVIFLRIQLFQRMNILPQVIGLMNKEEIRNFKLFINRTEKATDRKDEILYSMRFVNNFLIMTKKKY